MRYEKGRKAASRRHIVEVASERFRSDGIAASGLAGIMSSAGLTNGAFYPHFPSKDDLVRESVAAAMADQTNRLAAGLTAGGLEAFIKVYLSPAHRDHPGKGCALAALLPELARQSPEARRVYAQQLEAMLHHISVALTPKTRDRDTAALGALATLIGALQLARAVQGTALSDRILTDGATAARSIVQPEKAGLSTKRKRPGGKS